MLVDSFQDSDHPALLVAIFGHGPHRAAAALGRMRPVPQTAIAALNHAISDESVTVRAAAVEGIGQVDGLGPEVLQQLVAAAADGRVLSAKASTDVDDPLPARSRSR